MGYKSLYLIQCCRGASPDGNTSEIGKKVTLLRKQIGLLEEHEELLDKYVNNFFVCIFKFIGIGIKYASYL